MKCMKRKYEGYIYTVLMMCFLCYSFHGQEHDLSPLVVCALCNLCFTNHECMVQHYQNRCFEFDRKYIPYEFFRNTVTQM